MLHLLAFNQNRDFELVDKMQKAWFYEEYGPKEVLKMGAFPLPILQHDQLLVQVRAAALNPIDFKRRQQAIFPSGLPVVPGCDMAGIVADIAPGVSKFKVGDEVYGNIQDFNVPEKLKQLGTLAEYVAVEENLVALKPDNLSFEEAGSLPLALQTALEGFETANFQAGQSIFIVGGAGGVGTLVVQLAKHYFGASRVAATCSSSKVEFVKSLGADMVIDYTTTKYEEIAERFDFVYDTIGDVKKANHFMAIFILDSNCLIESLCLLPGDSENSFVVAKEEAPVVDITWPPKNPKAKYSSLTVTGAMLEKLRPYLESGKIKAVIDPTGPYHFNDVIEAFRYLETGRARGKVVLSSFPSSTSVLIPPSENGDPARNFGAPVGRDADP